MTDKVIFKFCEVNKKQKLKGYISYVALVYINFGSASGRVHFTGRCLVIDYGEIWKLDDVILLCQGKNFEKLLNVNEIILIFRKVTILK